MKEHQKGFSSLFEFSLSFCSTYQCQSPIRLFFILIFLLFFKDFFNSLSQFCVIELINNICWLILLDFVQFYPYGDPHYLN